jgi:hypothetical protein
MTPNQYAKATPLMDQIVQVAKQIEMARDINQISFNWAEKPGQSITKRDSPPGEFEPIVDAIKLVLQNKLVRLKKELDQI